MFTQIDNVTVIYDEGKRFISQFYEIKNYKRVVLLARYFASDMIKTTISLKKNTSGSINLGPGIIHYTGMRNGPIVFNYDDKPEIFSDKPDLYKLELMELINQLLLNKFGKLLEGKFIETFDVSDKDIGLEIDQILGLNPVHASFFKGKANKIWDLSESKIFDHFQNDLPLFHSIVELVASNKFQISEKQLNHLISVRKRLKRYNELHRWLGST